MFLFHGIASTACCLKTNADITASQVANVNHPQYPAFEDFGDVMLKGDHGAGYKRILFNQPCITIFEVEA